MVGIRKDLEMVLTKGDIIYYNIFEVLRRFFSLFFINWKVAWIRGVFRQTPSACITHTINQKTFDYFFWFSKISFCDSNSSAVKTFSFFNSESFLSSSAIELLFSLLDNVLL